MHTNDVDPPTVLATDRYNDGKFHFRCPEPDCRHSMSIRRVVHGELVTCRRKKCGAGMLLITKKQQKALLEHEREMEQRRHEAGANLPDQIVILGRPQSGKTVYLSVLYQALWRAKGDLSAIDTDGPSHEALLGQYQSMIQGLWPDGGQGTLNVQQHDWSIRYRGSALHLSTMDYPGEIYRKVFFDKQIDQPECEVLFRQVDSAIGVMLLLDPGQVVDKQADTVDIEFSCVQVVEHLSEHGLGDNFVVVLTKRDQNAALLAQHGGPRGFLREFMPRLYESLPTVHVISLCAMPEAKDSDGVPLRNDDGQTIPIPPDVGESHVLVPLRRLLEGIDPQHLRFMAEMDQRIARQSHARRRGPPPPTAKKPGSQE